ncbi:hypothetical protein [Crossiella sp. CA198]|uniref:hypothetical protein n=1 Tax=Crossiella sp. CA198 TaxID=3455607 RepID=UPI003F8CFD14
MHTFLARFVGGPLDGRWQTFTSASPAALATVTHVHLHQGPKIVHHYDLRHSEEHGWEYHLRQDADAEEC